MKKVDDQFSASFYSFSLFLQMIDTVILRIQYPKFKVLEPGKFQPHAGDIFLSNTFFNGQSYLKRVQNPTSQDRKLKNYKPKLTLYKRYGKKRGSDFPIDLEIEFSCPKFFFGNNFQELKESQFEELIARLQKKLYDEMGIQTSVEALRNAEVKNIHYSKNFLFTDHHTASGIIKDIQKVELTRRLDLNKTDFRNEGEALYYYSKSHCLIFYDKVKDLQQSKGRSMEDDNDFNFQPSLFDEIRREKKIPLEVLRMEVRLCTKQKIEQILKKLKIAYTLDFKCLFSEKIAQRVLFDYWEKVYEGARRNALVSRNMMDLFEAILKVPEITIQKALCLFSLLVLHKGASEREVYERIEKRFSKRSFYRYKKLLKEHDIIFHNRHTVFDDIQRQLLDFEMISEFSL